MATSDEGLGMKLQIVVDKKRNRVLFAEANKDFVDFIFHVLSYPIGAVQCLLMTETSASFGSVGTLYDGFNNLDKEYIQYPAKYYLLYQLRALNNCDYDKGYVKKLVTYMVMDDLMVRPSEPSSLISLMKLHSIKDVGDIERREVTFGTTHQIVKLFKAVVSSRTVLTDTFLGEAVKTEN